MSLFIAQVHKDHALLVTDTRACIDNKPVSDKITKIHPLPGGGFIASGPCAVWGEQLYGYLAYRAPQSLAELVEATNKWASTAMQELEAAQPAVAQLVRDKQTTFIIGLSDGAPYAAALDWSGDTVNLCGPDQVVMAGPDQLADVFPSLMDQYCGAIDRFASEMPQGAEPVVMAGALLRCAAFFCAVIADRCGPEGHVGPNMEAGVVVRVGEKAMSLYLERMPQRLVRDAPRIDALLVPVKTSASREAEVVPSMRSNLAFVRMNSLKLARREAVAHGLSGSAMDEFISTRVAADVKASIDQTTGASRLPDAREFATLPTFSTPLAEGSFGSSIEELVQKHPWLTPIMPFARTSVNVLKYTFVKSSPLGLLSENIRNTIKAGGPEGAITATRIGVGASVWSMAGLLAFSGDLTGRGPADPALRKMWLASHQPYSIKVGGEWVSYRRLEPFATPMSITADLAQMMRDNADDMSVQEDGSKLFYAVVASTANGVTNKTYLSGLVDFADAIGSGSPSRVKNFVDGLMSVGVPNILQTVHTDPYMRQTQQLFDAVVQRVPGWGSSLPAKYNVFGEPVTLQPGRVQRALNPLPMRDATPMLEDEILQLHRAFVAPPTIAKFGDLSVNLHNRAYRNRNGGHLTPYERLMEIVREQNLRGQVEQIVGSPAYQRAGDGTDVFAGGRRFKELQDRIERVYARAERKMTSEYPELARDLKGLGRARRVSQRSDVQGQNILDRLGR